MCLFLVVLRNELHFSLVRKHYYIFYVFFFDYKQEAHTRTLCTHTLVRLLSTNLNRRRSEMIRKSHIIPTKVHSHMYKSGYYNLNPVEWSHVRYPPHQEIVPPFCVFISPLQCYIHAPSILLTSFLICERTWACPYIIDTSRNTDKQSVQGLFLPFLFHNKSLI